MKLSGTIGVTQKPMTLHTHVRLILLQTLNPQEWWGTHKKRWPFQPRPFADVIGLVRCSYIYIFIYFYSSIYVYIVYMVGTRLHSGTFYGCVSKSGFCKFHEFPIEFAISRWWLPDLGHTLISAVKRKHNLDLIGLTRLLFHLQRSSACVRTRCRCLVGCVFFHSSGPWTRGSDGINKDGFLFHAPQVEKLTGNSFF